MVEKDIIFKSSIKYTGIFSFKDFYKFCYDWLVQETELILAERKYAEKITGDKKEIIVEWEGFRKLTDYFKFELKVRFEAIPLKEVEIVQGGKKTKTNEGAIKIIVKGTLIRDYQGKFEVSAFRKFLRSIYEKWVISSRIDQMEDKIIGDSDEFLTQAKAYLDLEGKR